MKIIKTVTGNRIKICQKEWKSIGKKAGWMKEAGFPEDAGLSEDSSLPVDMSTKPVINIPRAQAMAWSLKSQAESLSNGLSTEPLNAEVIDSIKTVFTSIENTVGMLRDMIQR